MGGCGLAGILAMKYGGLGPGDTILEVPRLEVVRTVVSEEALRSGRSVCPLDEAIVSKLG
jgi:hypothetical protein